MFRSKIIKIGLIAILMVAISSVGKCQYVANSLCHCPDSVSHYLLVNGNTKENKYENLVLDAGYDTSHVTMIVETYPAGEIVFGIKNTFRKCIDLNYLIQAFGRPAGIYQVHFYINGHEISIYDEDTVNVKFSH